MSFENVKSGDDVLLSFTVKSSIWDRSGKVFYLRRLVERTTKVLFIVDGRQFNKSDGRERKAGYDVDRCKPYKGKCDQKAYEAYIKLLNSKAKLREVLSGVAESIGEFNQADIDHLISVLGCYANQESGLG